MQITMEEHIFDSRMDNELSMILDFWPLNIQLIEERNMFATKYRVDTHPIVRYWPKKGRTMLLMTIYGQYKREPYVIDYKSDGAFMEIRYTGEKFGLEELNKSQKFKRTIGGHGAKTLLQNPEVSHRYEMGVNIWRAKGDFKVFECQRPIPKEIGSFKDSQTGELSLTEFAQYYEYEADLYPDPVFEITYNIIAHHNIMYEKTLRSLS